MSKFVCDSGEVTFASTDINSMCINNVTIDISADSVNYICMGDDLWQSSDSSTKRWSVSFESALDSAEGIDISNTIGASGAFEFDTIDGKRYYGTAIITSISVNAPVDDYATVSWEATGVDALTEAATDG